MIYVTEWDFCPVGCGMGVIFLKSVETGRIFLHCMSCGVAWDKPPAPHAVDALDPPERFAPKGIALPSREEIEAAGLGYYIAAEGPDEDYVRCMWRLRARTLLEAGDHSQAIEVLSDVIDTWHRPPSVAYQLRAVAYRCIGDLLRAVEDERAAEQVDRERMAAEGKTYFGP